MQCFQSHTRSLMVENTTCIETSAHARTAAVSTPTTKGPSRVAVALTLAAAFWLMACAPGPPSDSRTPTTPLSCVLSEQPACLASCSQHLEVASAVCERSEWRCDHGIDSRVCCDIETSPEACPVWAQECDYDPVALAPTSEVPEPETSAPSPCPDGYTCVNSRTHPIPAERGVCRLGDLQVPPQMTQCSAADATAAAFLPLLDTGPVKVQGVLVIDTTCESNTCSAGNACCNDCYGSYRLVLDGGTIGVEGGTIPILTESIACVGTNCGITCSPMQPGRRYLVWGTYSPSSLDGDIGQLHHVGHCPL